MINFLKKIGTGSLLAILIFLSSFGDLFAASIYFFPASATKSASSNFTVTVFVNSSDATMNAISGSISVPRDKLEVVSISKANSIVNLWVQEPKYDSASQSITFEGIVLNPGYKGATGRIINITFKPKASGAASLRFGSGSILENDGEGTNILNELGTGVYILEPDAVAGFPETKEVREIVKQTKELPGAPKIDSNTHPNEDAWYNSRTIAFSWDMPAAVDAVSYVIDSDPKLKMVPQGRGLIGGVAFDGSKFNDGSVYFQLQYHTSAGWGPVGKRMARIDFTRPSISGISRVDEGDNTNPHPVFSWSATDAASGIAKYQIKIDSSDWVDVPLAEANAYKLANQTPGEHQLILRAYDAANNSSDTGTVFTVEALPEPKVEKISHKFVSPNEKFYAEGLTIPKGKIEANLSRNGNTLPVFTEADQEGRWRIEFKDKIAAGLWDASFRVIDERGAMSRFTEKQLVEVVSPWVKVTQALARIMMTFGILFVILGILGSLVYYLFGVAALQRIRMRREVAELKARVNEGLGQLEKELAGLKTGEKNEKEKEDIKKAEDKIKQEIARLQGELTKVQGDLDKP